MIADIFYDPSYLTEASLGDSVIFNMMNNQKKLSNRINEAISSSVIINEQNIQEQLMQINRMHISPSDEYVVDTFRKGDIIILYNKNISITQAVPFITTKIGKTIKTFIFIAKYGNLTESQKVNGGVRLTTQTRDLYALMEGAYIQNQYTKNPLILTKNLGLMKLTTVIYTSMIMRILNREYALSIDESLYNRVSYSISRFYLERVWMCQNKDIIESYAIFTTSNADKTDISLVSDSYTNAHIEKLSDLFDFIKTLSPRISTVTTRYVVECYINLYHGASIFGIDCLPYFLFTLTSSLLGSFIVNQPVVSDILKNTKGMNGFYSELGKVFRA